MSYKLKYIQGYNSALEKLGFAFGPGVGQSAASNVGKAISKPNFTKSLASPKGLSTKNISTQLKPSSASSL